MTPHLIRVVFVAFLILATGFATAGLKPADEFRIAAPDLDQLMPEKFGVWRRIEISNAVLPAETELGPGEAVAYRGYQDDLGRVITLVAAYGPPQGDSVRLHRPEKCYVAQGFEIVARSEQTIVARGRAIPIVNLDTQNPSRREAVTYWLRDGGAFTTRASDNGWRRLKGSADRLDGALLRISTIHGEAPAFAAHAAFLEAFAAALDPEAAAILLGSEAAS